MDWLDYRWTRFLVIVAGAVTLDLFTKQWALQSLMPYAPLPPHPPLGVLRLVFNDQLAFSLSLPGGGRVLYAVLSMIALAAVAWIAARTPARATHYATGFALVIGGGLGNVIERVFRGQVTDFVSVGVGFNRFPTFNVADILATTGAALYLWLRVRDGVTEEGWRRTLFTLQPLPPSLRTQAPGPRAEAAPRER